MTSRKTAAETKQDDARTSTADLPEASDLPSRLPPQHDPGLFREFLEFLRHEKKWWLAPILLCMLVLTLVALVSLSPAAPFIYTLF